MKEEEILDRSIFVGGPPRSGTTFAAKSLNLHPGVVTAIDDHVYECWGLYFYRDRAGLVRELRTRELTREEVRNSLKNHLFKDERLVGAAPSPKTALCEPVSKIEIPYPGSVRSALDKNLERLAIPVDQFSDQWRLCLKSPEITFVLPQLASHFPGSKFVLVYRPVAEIAESMYRLGNRVKKFPIFHKRWMEEKGETGELMAPPGVPTKWGEIWRNATDFQRCVIYAASYIHGLLEGIEKLSPDRYVVYNHAHLRDSPNEIFNQLAQFLDVDTSGFQPAVTQLNTGLPSIHPKLMDEYFNIEFELALKPIMQKIESLSLVK
jgi:hypothetical protein